jgi:hypothetical protein
MECNGSWWMFRIDLSLPGDPKYPKLCPMSKPHNCVSLHRALKKWPQQGDYVLEGSGIECRIREDFSPNFLDLKSLGEILVTW